MTKTQLINRCMTSAYLTMGVLKLIGNTDLSVVARTHSGVYTVLTEEKGQGQERKQAMKEPQRG